MIFVTVGYHEPFDRLVRVVDDWAALHPDREVFAQIGDSSWHPEHVPWCDWLLPAQYRRVVGEASCVISHAGIGAVCAARRAAVPLLVMPRRAELGEADDEHQSVAARQFARADWATVVEDETQLADRLTDLDQLRRAPSLGPHADREMLEALHAFAARASL